MLVYTRRGDNGVSKLMTGKSLPKNSDIFEVLGSLDELNSVLGEIHTFRNKTVVGVVRGIQGNILYMSSCLAGGDGTNQRRKEIYWLNEIKKLEDCIDYYDGKNPPLNHLIIPGGSHFSVVFHVARTVCRKAERRLVGLYHTNDGEKEEYFISYLNRLSDLLFVLARYVNTILGVKDAVWEGAKI